MNSRGLTLALRLLTTACAGVALGTMTGCPFFFGCGDETGWQEQVPIALEGVDADLRGVVWLGEYDDARNYSYLAVGSAGAVVVWGDENTDAGYGQPWSASYALAGAPELWGAATDEFTWWVVGEGGTVASTTDRGQSWTFHEPGTVANLHAVARHGAYMVVAGDGVIALQASDGTWSEAPAPVGGWGELRAIYTDGERIWAVGRSGVAWSAEDPSGAWEAEDVGTTVDLLGLDRLYVVGEVDGKYGDRPLVVGANGTLRIRESDGSWSVVDIGISEDLVDASAGVVLAANGRIFALDSSREVTDVGTVAGARAVYHQEYAGLATVGDAGEAIEIDYYECVGGRPFVVDAELRTAALRTGEGFCGGGGDGDGDGDELEPIAIEPELGEALAAAWAQDGLYEHASVASFARFALELLALGAPPQLVRAVSAASVDELGHARLCFGLARRYGGVALEPGPLPISAGALARVGDPVATALALFEEGCLNESVAACEAAEAAAGCADAAARAALEILAADERRHAALAWQALRWLLDAHGERVRGPLRNRIASLGLPRAVSPGTHDERLEAFGRLSPVRRVEVTRRVVAELVRPLALAMVEARPATWI